MHDILGASVFLMIFSAVVFLAPEFGGYFLEYNNFIPADPLKTPAHIAPVWYFPPYYSMLRATTETLIYGAIIPLVALSTAWYIFKASKSVKRKVIVGSIATVSVALLLLFEAKFWGVVIMGASVLILFALPWLDKSPVKSIRYKPAWHKWVYGLFVANFFMLGYFGILPPTTAGTVLSQIGTVLYFAFFLLMPFWSKVGTFKPVPERIPVH